jgi:hypothetical protein
MYITQSSENYAQIIDQSHLCYGYESQSSSTSASDTETEGAAKSRDWNKEFQMYLREPNPNVKYRKLSKLAKDFVSVAEEYGR